MLTQHVLSNWYYVQSQKRVIKRHTHEVVLMDRPAISMYIQRQFSPDSKLPWRVENTQQFRPPTIEIAQFN